MMIVFIRQHGIWISGRLVSDNGISAVIDLATGQRDICQSGEYQTEDPRDTHGEWAV